MIASGKSKPSLYRAMPLAIAGLLLALRLAIRKNSAEPDRSRSIIDSASDAIITVDDQQTILRANPAAAAMFGSTVHAMRGAALDQFIPRDLRTFGEHEAAGHFGDSGLNLRMMGRRVTDYAVSGLKASGEQFPLEGSISVLLEHGFPVYTIIVRDITERKQVHEQLERSFSQLRQLSSALQTIREEERKYIARELHDDLGQLLATLRLDLTLAAQHAAHCPDTARILHNMDGLLVTAITSLRRLASNLRPRALDEGGLYFALQSLRQEFLERHKVHFELLADEADLILDDAFSTAIYRIVQESLTNIARHAQANNVTIALHRLDSKLEITIQDDGLGIEDSDLEKAASLGLLGMRERVWALHGTISIGPNNSDGEQHDDGGTRIDILLPLPSPTS
ncbi:PAS domain-containing sensor histidine kinase [Janthinobacterium agaricidamnosum]|uniref:Sensory box protein n=1 Tax=Janthinobacterium agaricidamnosum NBRC 102515 = DSM 9628 TaxID=1349767 RepID=W0VB94_9BURK|nr:PAS domain-containing sensor histidine kinase [Janthinobacterium agaricidamnosum]CDG84532.1 sensory box protein [Janthinobacterium agaricidamnosum NBRC 102515 = DSM 9628]